jgi:hypothetical protein
MEIVGGEKYDHKKEDCPYVLSLALQKKYNHIPKLGCMLSNSYLMSRIRGGLKKHGMKPKEIYSSKSSKQDFINELEVIPLITYLFQNKKDGFMVLEHNNPKETRHLFAFLFNHKHKTLDFFDSYNDTRTFFTLRLKSRKVKEFLYDVFHKYFKDEFLIEKCFEFNYM